VKKAALSLLSFALLLASSAASVRGQSALDGFDPNANDLVRVIVVQPDGKILIGGDFTTLAPNGGATVTRSRIARLNPDGTLDTAFNPNADGVVFSIVLQADGKILAGGSFTGIGGQLRNRIARLDPVTGQADSFDPNANNQVNAIALQADGKILVGGYFNGANSVGGQARNYIARLDPATGLADSFDPHAELAVFSIVLQADGKVLAGGVFTSIGGQLRNHIARLDPATGLADSFDPNASSNVLTIAVQADGKILAGGAFTSIGGQTRNRLARLDATTGLADSFVPNANNLVLAIALQPDGRILACGFFTSIGGQTRKYIARLEANTGQADSFDPNPNSDVSSIAVQPDGKILMGGYFNGANGLGGQARNCMARVEVDGRVDRTLNLNIGTDTIPFVSNNVVAIAVQPDGKILIGGTFTSVLGATRHRIARLNTDGTLDPAFDPNATGEFFPYDTSVNTIAVQADGKILVAGKFSNIGGQPRNCMARLDPTTGLADSFDPDPNKNINTSVNSILVQPDGKILVCGQFAFIGGAGRNGFARLDPTTGLVDSLPSYHNGNVFSMALQPDGKIIVGGYFSTVFGQPRNKIARLDPVTGLADSFNPNADDSVRSMLIQPDGKILVGGWFRHIGGQARDGIARLDPATGLADSFDPDPSNVVDSLVLQANGKVLLSGQFGDIGGTPRQRIARVDGTTGLADSFDPHPNGYLSSIAVQASGKILLGGPFTGIGGQRRAFFARFSNETAALQNLGVTQNAIAWTLDGASPQFYRVTFESSNDGVSYLPLGAGTASGNNWTLAGLSLPTGQNFYIRARGYHRSGYGTASESIMESIRNAFVAGPTPTPTPTPTATPSTTPNEPHFEVSAPPFAFLGISFDITVTAKIFDNVFTNYTGTVHFTTTSTGFGTQLPDDSTLTNGVGTFSVRLGSEGFQTITARDTVNPSMIGTSGNILVMFKPPPSPTPSPTPTPMPAAQALNISTRMKVQTGDNVGIGGFIITGTAPKHVLLRAIGPSLAQFGVPGVLADPVMELHGPGGFATVTNNNWGDDPVQAAAILATGLAPTNDLEAAIDAILNPGAYTAIVRGNNNTTGIGLVEVYDLSQAASSKLANISTRAFVGTGNEIMIAGFILGGNSGNDTVILRGMGPSLANFGVPLPLADPTLELRDSNGAPLHFNNDWEDHVPPIPPQIAPGNPRESVIVATLPPGQYTALLAGLNNGTGVGLVEVYDQGNGSGAPTPTPTPPVTPTPSGTPSPIPTPSPLCFVNEGFDDINTLPWAGWVQINHSVPFGTTGWFQGNGAVFPAQTGTQTSYIAANFDNAGRQTNPGTAAGQYPASRPPGQLRTPPSPTPNPTPPIYAISNWLLTPPVTLQNGAVMTFYTRTVDVPQFPDRLQVRMSTSGTSTNVGTTAYEVGDFTVLMLDINPNLTTGGYPNAWTQFMVTVSGVASPATGRLALRYFVPDGGTGFPNGDYIGIDQVSFSCTTPTPSPTPPPTPSPAPQSRRG
jgi:uncharacterized delta-60 repeat protein